jgi:hypothetical protein
MRRSDRYRPAAIVALLLAGAVMAAPALDAAAPNAVFTELLSRLPPAQRAQLQPRLQQWNGWTPGERAAFAERAAAWAALTPAERARRREAYQAWRDLPDSQREEVVDAARVHVRMPEADRQALRARFQVLDLSQQRGWRLGPALGADYATLQPLLAQVPSEQHEPLMEVLRSMTSAQRTQLGVLVQRTPPQQRDALRRDLIATPLARRQQWLWEQLDR